MACRLSDTDRAPVMMRRTSRGLEPVAAFDLERLDRYSFGSDLEVRIMQRRSLPQHRLYWAMLARVVENTDQWPSAEHLHEAIKYHLGYTQPLRTVDGRTVWRPDSTAFASMDAAEFRVFFDRAVEVISEVVLPGVDPIALVSEARGTA
jgi:hypothetical protein